jgi:hypothetical protein
MEWVAVKGSKGWVRGESGLRYHSSARPRVRVVLPPAASYHVLSIPASTAPGVAARSLEGEGRMLRRVLSGAMVSIASLVACLIAAEIALRLLGVGSDPYVRPHPWTGWVLAPNLRVTVASEDPALGRRIELRTDSLGLHDVERSAEKPPGVFRVLVLGDSYVMAHHVPPESALTRRMERVLDGRDGRRVEVWNCGVEGYGTAQELLYLRHVTYRFHPDLVVLGFFAGNDVVDQVPELATSLRGRPFFRLGDQGLSLDRGHVNFRTRTLDWMRTHLRLFDWANARRHVLMARLRHHDAAAAGPGGIPPPLQIYREHPDSLWSLAWDITERLVADTRDEARSQGAGFLLVAFPAGVQVHANGRKLSPGWQGWERVPGVALDRPERRLTRLCAERGIEFLPLLPAFRKEVDRSGRPLHIEWVGHLNSAGHAVAARLIAARVAELLKATAPPSAAASARPGADPERRPGNPSEASEAKGRPSLAASGDGLIE